MPVGPDSAHLKSKDAPVSQTPAYKRILLKLSGEALMGGDNFGINRDTVDRIVSEVAEVVNLGVEVAASNVFGSRERSMSVVAAVVAAQIAFSAPANNDRVNGWQRMMEYLDDVGDEQPGIKFFDTCENAIRTIPNLNRDRRRPEDVDTDGEDHAADSVRYFLMTQAGLTRSDE